MVDSLEPFPSSVVLYMTGSAFPTEISFKLISCTQAFAHSAFFRLHIVHVLSTSEKPAGKSL